MLLIIVVISLNATFRYDVALRSHLQNVDELLSEFMIESINNEGTITRFSTTENSRFRERLPTGLDRFEERV